jgi:hypothetical protein
MLAFRNDVQKSVNEANNDYLKSSSTTNIDHTKVKILGIDGVGGGGDITQSRTLYLDLTSLDASNVIDVNADYLVYYDASTSTHYRILINDLLSNTTSDKHYAHTQGVASDTWSVTHSLNKYPSVTVVDSGGTTVVGDIQHVDLNNAVLSFSWPFSGAAYFN